MHFQRGSMMLPSIPQCCARLAVPHLATGPQSRGFSAGVCREALIKIVLSCIVAWFAMVPMASAQNAQSATVVGNVTDSTGAVVPNASVTLTNSATNVSTKGTTNSDGAYYIPYLAPGTYTLTIQAAGFSKYMQTGIVLVIGGVPSYDVKLTVGEQSSQVEVSATEQPLLETQDVAIGGLDDAKFIQQQPMMQAKPYHVMYYMMGAEQTSGPNGYSLAGLPGNEIQYSLDGIGAKQTPRSAIGDVNNAVTPPVDALQEAKVWTTGIPAEQGHDSGGAINMVTKSGTNDLHWTAEERYIEKDWIHRSIFQQSPTTTPFEYHNFDSTLGGPIVIPKIYNGRDKSFFFLGFRFDYDHETNTTTNSTPTLAMEGEDPTLPPGAYFNWTGAQPIYDPATITCTIGTCANGKGWTAQRFPGNVIPLNRIDPVAKAFLAQHPYFAPNTVGNFVNTGPANNLIGNQNYLADKDGYIARFDQVLTSKDKLYFRWAWNRYRTHPGRQNIIYSWTLIDPTANAYSRPEPIDTNNFVVDETHVFGPALINEFRVGYQRRLDTVTPFADNENWAAKLGIPGVPGNTFPAFVTTGGSNVTWSADPGNYFRTDQDDFEYGDDMTLVKGHHVFKWGWEGLRLRENDTGTETQTASTVPLPSGLYNFSGSGTGLPFTANTGNSFASFLLGAVDNATYSEQLERYEPRWWSNELYFEDSWRVKSNLTINAGLRYTLENAGNTKAGFKSEFNPSVTDPLTGDMGAITNPAGPLYNNAGFNFAPRIGVDYNFRTNWVFRGAFDLFTADNLQEMGMDNYEALAVVAQAPGNPKPGMYLSQGPGPINYPINSNNTSSYESASGNYVNRTATYLDPKLHNGHTMSWSAGFQYQFKPTTIIEFDYIGSTSYGLVNPYPVNINALPQSIITSTDKSFQQTVFTDQQAYLPFPQFGAINYYTNWVGSNFNSGTVDVKKNYSHGLSFDFHYTYEKLIDEGPGSQQLSTTGVSTPFTVGTGAQLNIVGPNPLTIGYNRAATRGLDPGSFKHQFTGTTTWDIPVGHGRRWMNHSNIGDIFLGGWTLLTIQSLRSGYGVSFLAPAGQVGNPNNEFPGEVFMNHVAGQPIKTPNFSLNPHNMWPEQNQNPYYNIKAFAYPAPFTQGNTGIGATTNGGVWWPQYSLSKTVAYREKYKLTVRMDADNLFPQTHTMNPSNAANVTSPSLFGKTAQRGL